MTAEGIILHQKAIPVCFRDYYIRFQSHFDIKRVIKKYLKIISKSLTSRSNPSNKLLLYSRSSPLIQSLPDRFPHPDVTDEAAAITIRDIITENPDKVMLHKLSYLTSQTSVQQLFKEFILSDRVEVLLILADMNNICTKTINHARILMEESEIEHATDKDIPKLFILLLHFPALFQRHCYPTLYLKGWDHIYLDAIAYSKSENMVNVEHWLKNCWNVLSQEKIHNSSDSYEEDVMMIESMRSILKLTIPIICSRVQFGQGSDNSFNSVMTTTERYNALKKIIFEYNIGEVLCECFASYWKRKVKLELLKNVAMFSKQSQSTLSITESVNANIKSLFFDFCVYMLTSANEDYNLDILFSEVVSSPVHILFKKILKLFPLPKLKRLSLLSKHYIPMQPCTFRLTFPFFKLVFKQFEKLVQQCLKSINFDTELLYKRTSAKPQADPESKLKQLVSEVQMKIQCMKTDAQTTIVNTVLQFMDLNLSIWKRYFCDFITYKLHPGQSKINCDAKRVSDIPLRILQSFFKQMSTSSNEVKMKLIQLHCHTAVYHINLAQLANVFLPLCIAHELHLHIPSLASTDGQTQSSRLNPAEQLILGVQPNYPVLGSPANVSDFVISTLFETLENTMVNAKNLDSWKVWCSTYRDIMTFPTLVAYIYMCSPKAIFEISAWNTWEAKLNIMHVTYLFFELHPLVDIKAQQLGRELFLCLHKKYMQGVEIICPQLSEVYEIITEKLSLRKDDSREITVNKRIAITFIDGILSHYFSPYLKDYHEKDVRWFLTKINEQCRWKKDHSHTAVMELTKPKVTEEMEEGYTNPAKNWWSLPELSMFKSYLSRILGSNYEQKGSQRKNNLTVLSLYNNKMRDTLSSAVCPVESELGSKTPYIPFHYKQQHTNYTACSMQQPLCHLYFNIVLEHMTSDSKFITYKPSDLIFVIKKMKDILNNSERQHSVLESTSTDTSVINSDGSFNKGDVVLLRIEIQATIQLLIRKIAPILNPNKPQSLGELQSLLPDLNKILSDNFESTLNASFTLVQNHSYMLLYHLQKTMNSSRHLIQFCTQSNSSLRSINCLIPTLEQFKNPSSEPLLVCYLQKKCNKQWMKAYNSINKILIGIDKDENTVDDLDHLAISLFEDEEVIQVTDIAGDDDTGISLQNSNVSDVSDNSNVYQDRLIFRMLLWFVIYYEFYNKNRRSRKLCEAMNSPKLFKHFRDDSCTHLFKCFLQPERMVKATEKMVTLTEYQVLLLEDEGLLNGIRNDKNELTDPIYDLFNNIEKSDEELNHALANLIGILLGTSPQSNHLWNQTFAANNLKGTYMTGSKYAVPVGVDGHYYDQDVDCTIQALYYRSKNKVLGGTCSLHSLNFLLWVNFASFCMSLLTQHETQQQYLQQIISKDNSLRSYCFFMLKTLWISIKANLSISSEERSLLVMEATWNIYETFSNYEVDAEFTFHGSAFNSIEELSAYEKFWHTRIYQPALSKLPELCTEYMDKNNRAVLQTIKDIGIDYPSFPSLTDFINYMQQLGDPSQLYDGGDLHIITTFVLEKNKLELIGHLLPDLIEFYNWLHSSFSVSFDKAVSYKIGHVIKKCIERTSNKQFAEHLCELFKRVKDGCTKYLETFGVNCLNDKYTPMIINDETTLICLLSSDVEESEGKDWIYKLIEDIISCHNFTINNFYSLKQEKLDLLPQQPAVIHPTEVNKCTAIFTDHQREGDHHGIDSLLQLIRSCYHSNSKQNNSLYDLTRLKELLVSEFIIGRPLISSPTSLRISFDFNQKYEDSNVITLMKKATNTALKDLAECMPDDFKTPLSETQVKLLEYEFHSVDYHLLYEIVDGIRNAVGLIIRDYRELPENSTDDIQDLTVSTFLQKLNNGTEHGENLLQMVGIKNLKHSQEVCLNDLPLISIFSCLKFFIQWTDDGSYNFRMVPLSFKKHIVKKDLMHLESVSDTYKSNKTDLLEELDHFIEILKNLEQHITQGNTENIRLPIVQYIGSTGLSERFISHIADTITLQHYMELRLTLLRLWLKTEQDLKACGQYEVKFEVWKDNVIELWEEHLPEMRIERCSNANVDEEQTDQSDSDELLLSDDEEGEEENEEWRSIHDKSIPIVTAEQESIGNDRAPQSDKQSHNLGRKKMDKKEMSEWLKNEGIDQKDVQALYDNGVNELWFMRLKPPDDKRLKNVSDDTIELIKDLQDLMKTQFQ